MISISAARRIVRIGVIADLVMMLGVTAYAAQVLDTGEGDTEAAGTIRIVDDSVVYCTTAPTEETTVGSMADPMAEPADNLLVDLSADEAGSSPRITYDDTKKCLFFDGPDKCPEIEFYAGYLPEDYVCHFPEGMNAEGWNKYGLQVTDDEKGNVINISIGYTSDFGCDGRLYFGEEFTSVETDAFGEYIAVRMEGFVENDGSNTEYRYDNCYLILEHPEGYILLLSGRDMSELERIAEDLEIRKTGDFTEYDFYADHVFRMRNGVCRQ